jgi:hypothetical protein
MASKVIKLPLKKKPSLSRHMIVALVEACTRQQHGIPFGPADIKGSFSFLISRGLVAWTDVASQSEMQSLWQVTPEAVDMLRKMGVDVRHNPDSTNSHVRL